MESQQPLPEQRENAEPAGSAPALPSDLLTVSASLFRRHGYAGTTTRQLAAAMGIGKASLYHYIDTKEDLLYTLCVRSLETITDQVRAAVERSDPPERVSAMIAAHVRSMLHDQDMHAVMLLELRSLSRPRLDDVISRRDRYESNVESVLAHGQRAGMIRTDIKSRHLALGLLNLLNWTIFWYRLSGELNPDEVVTMMRTIFLDGVRPPQTT